MELCRELAILLYHAVLVEGLGLFSMGTTTMDVKDKVEAKAKDTVDDVSAKYHIVHSPSGDIKDQFLVVFSKKDSQDAFMDKIVQDIKEIDGVKCKATCAYQAPVIAALLKGKCEMQLVHCLKPFSGSDKPGPGECNVTDWIEAAKQLMDLMFLSHRERNSGS